MICLSPVVFLVCGFCPFFCWTFIPSFSWPLGCSGCCDLPPCVSRVTKPLGGSLPLTLPVLCFALGFFFSPVVEQSICITLLLPGFHLLKTKQNCLAWNLYQIVAALRTASSIQDWIFYANYWETNDLCMYKIRYRIFPPSFPGNGLTFFQFTRKEMELLIFSSVCVSFRRSHLLS